MSPTYRQVSRQEWSRKNELVYDEDIKNGALQRIADATELIARDHQNLVNREKWATERADSLSREVKHLERANAALRGHLKRLKRSSQ